MSADVSLAPNFTAYRDAAALRQLLGPAIYGRQQDSEGGYGGTVRALTDEDLRAHFADERTVGLCVIVGYRSRTLVIDIDDRFKQRLPLLAVALTKRGLEHASIATSGSDAGRGKVIVFFARLRSPAAVRRLGRELLVEAKQIGSAWGIESSGSVSVFPLAGQGGLIRIGGRNVHPRRAAAAVDAFFSIHGELRRLEDVVPAGRVQLRANPVPIPPAAVGKWVAALQRHGVSYKAGSKAVYLKILRLAHEAIRVYGTERGHHVFSDWTREVWKHSPDQHAPSPSGDKRAARSWDRRCANAWKHAADHIVSRPGPWNLRFLDNVVTQVEDAIGCSSRSGIMRRSRA